MWSSRRGSGNRRRLQEPGGNVRSTAHGELLCVPSLFSDPGGFEWVRAPHVINYCYSVSAFLSLLVLEGRFSCNAKFSTFVTLLAEMHVQQRVDDKVTRETDCLQNVCDFDRQQQGTGLSAPASIYAI